jgi:Flp pilus assembly protein TadD
VEVTAPGTRGAAPDLEAAARPAEARNEKPHASFLREVLTGAGATLVASLIAVIAARLIGGDGEFSVDMFSPYAFVDSVRSLVLELSTQDGRALLAAAGGLAVLTGAVGVVWLRADPDAEPEGWAGRLRAELCNGKTTTGIGLFALIALGAFAYQWWLWERVLPFAADDTGIVFARTLDAPPLEQSVDALMLAQGGGGRVSTKEFPLRRIEWEPGFLQRMRTVGADLGADAVVLYDQESGGDDARWAATLMFTEPDLGLVLGQGADDPTMDVAPADGASSALGGAVAEPANGVKPDQANPVLRGDLAAGGDRRKAAADLVYAALGILAYREDRFAEASTMLDRVDPDRMGLLNPGVIDFYRGNAFLMQERWLDAEAAYEAADAFYAGQGAAALRPQDRLIHAKVRVERGLLAQNLGDWDDALRWFAGGADLAPAIRADLAAGAAGLDAADVHATLARVYGLRADVHRRLGDAAAARIWKDEGARELALLDAAVADEPDRNPARLVENARSLAALGACSDASALLAEALRDPAVGADIPLNLELAWLHRLNYRSDLARGQLATLVAGRPDSARAVLAEAGFLRVDRGLWGWLADPELVIYDDAEVSVNFYEPDVLAETELMYRRVLGLPPFAAADALDPNNAAAERALAELAALRFDAARLDMTALLSGDAGTLAKSSVLFPRAPARRDAALAAIDEAIAHRLAIQNRLTAGDADNAGTLAFLWNQRATFLMETVADDRHRLGIDPDADRVEQVLDALAEAETWATVVLDDPAAPLPERLSAWNNHFVVHAHRIAWHAGQPLGAGEAEAARAEFRAAFGAMETEMAALDRAALSADEAGSVANNLSWIDRESRAFAEAEVAAAQERRAEFAALAEESRREDVIHVGSVCAGMDELHAAWAAQGEERYEEALRHAEAAVAASPGHPEAINVLGVSRAFLGDYGGATAAFTEAAAILPEEPVVRFNLAVASMMAGDEAAAETAFADAFRLVGRDGPQRRLAFMRSMATDFSRFMRLAPGSAADILPGLRLVAAELDRIEPEVAAAGGYQYPAVYARLGQLALDAGDPMLAERLLRRSVALDPDQPAALTALALAAADQGRDPDPESAALVRQLYAPIWRDATIAADAWLPRVMQQINVHARRFPDRAAALEPIREALAAPGLDEGWTRYTDPAYGYTVPLADPWGWAATRLTEPGHDFFFGVWNDDGTQRDKVTADGMEAYGGDPARCVADQTSAYEFGAASAAPVGAGERRYAGETADAAWATVELRDVDGNESATVHVRCRVLIPGRALLVLTHLTWDAYDAERVALREEMFDRVGLPAPEAIAPPSAFVPPRYVPAVDGAAMATPVAAP